MADLKGLMSFVLLYLMYVVDCLELSVSECGNLGMLPGLMCHSCNALDKFQLSSLTADCQQCCEADKDGDKPQRIYPFAELVVCG